MRSALPPCDEVERIVSRILTGLAVVVALLAVTKEASTADQDTSPTGAQPELTPAEHDEWSVDDRFDHAKALVLTMIDRLRTHHTTMIAGSLAYYAFLAMIPAAIAGISIYGLIFDPTDVAEQIESLADVLPEDAASVIATQLEAIVSAPQSGLGFASVIGLLLVIWSASAATKSLIVGINIAYGERETRNFAILRGMGVLLALALIIFVLSAVALVTFLPGLLADAGLGDAGARAMSLGRWPAIFVVVIAGLGLLYKLAPNRPANRTPWFSWGAFTGAVLWTVVTVGFSIYANSFGRGNFNETYGTLAGVIVLLLWFFLSGLSILLGAEVNDELEERRLAARS